MDVPSSQPVLSETLTWSGFKKEFDEHKEEVKKLKEEKENLAGEVAELRKLLQNVQEYTKTNSVEEVKDKKKDIVSILKSIADVMRVPSKNTEIGSPCGLKRSRTFLVSRAPKTAKGTWTSSEKDKTSSPDSKKSSTPSSPESKESLPTKKKFMSASKKVVKQKKYFQNLGGKSKLPVRKKQNQTNTEKKMPNLKKTQ